MCLFIVDWWIEDLDLVGGGVGGAHLGLVVNHVTGKNSRRLTIRHEYDYMSSFWYFEATILGAIIAQATLNRLRALSIATG